MKVLGLQVEREGAGSETLAGLRIVSRGRLEPGQSVISHGPDRDLTVAQALSPASGAA